MHTTSFDLSSESQTGALLEDDLFSTFSQVTTQSVSADAFGVPTPSTTVAPTYVNNIDGLLSGTKWTSTSVSFSFTDSINDYELGYPSRASHAASFQTLNATQRAAARSWIAAFNNISGLSLFELTGTSDRNATIRMAMSSVPGTAFAYYPGNSVAAGDAWFNRNNYNDLKIGSYAYRSFGHELGHALGLKHGHETGGVRNVAMDSNRDSMEFSILTYRSYVGKPLTSGYSNEAYGHAQSLMMYDIRAIQQMYGASFTHNSSNTTYTFSTTTGEMFANGVGQGQPGVNRIFRTIWDGNGVDTYNFSNYTTNLSIDLAPGGWSDLHVGGNNQRSYLGDGRYARGHVFNALQYNGDVRSLIENANGGSGNDIIKGNSANNVLNGNAGNDTLYGYGGNDTLNGGTGNDTMYGGTGNDYYYVDSASDVVVEYLNEGTDTVNSSVSYTLGSNLENLVLSGTAYSGSGNTLNNVIYGNNYNNYLWGNAGNDTLYGYGGNDTLDGGTGNDTMYGGTGNDYYYVDSASDVVVEYLNEGTDTVNSSVNYTLGSNLENLVLSGTAYSGYGNTLNNVIQGNSSNNYLWGGDGNDTLYGYGGNDTLNGGTGNDTLDGGTGNDTMYGGTGNDYYYVDSASDVVVEYLNQGTDTVNSSVNYTLGSNLENLVLSGAAYSGYGNTLNNVITGNSYHNYLWGGDGNDTLNGGSGNDTLVGGFGDDNLTGGYGADILWGNQGADKFIFNYLSEGIDIIKDFQWIEGDKIQISGSGFGASSLSQFSYNSSTGALFFDPFGATGPTQFVTIENKPSGFAVGLDIVIV